MNFISNINARRDAPLRQPAPSATGESAIDLRSEDAVKLPRIFDKGRYFTNRYYEIEQGLAAQPLNS
jgi:hypothetical protein